ncbi:hypothetical protein MRX96_017308 [Rhipicephalus microplus]
MGDHSERPRLMPHSDGPRPRRRLFHGRPQHTLPGSNVLMCTAYAQQLFGFPFKFRWTPGPTLPTEPLPYYYVERPYTVVARILSLLPWMVSAISYEVALNHGTLWPPDASPHFTRNGNRPRLPEMQLVNGHVSHSPVEQGTEAVRSKGTRVQTHQPLPGFDGLRCAAYAQQLLGLPSTFPWTPGPTLPTEPLPYYYVQRPYTVVARFPWLPPWMVPAISYEVAPKHGAPWPPGASPHVARNGTPLRLPEMQVVKRRGGSETPRSLSKKEQQEHIELFLTRLLRAVADLGLGVPTEKEEPRPSARKFVYSAATLRSLNVRRRVSTPAPLSQYRDENPQGSATSTSSGC